MRNIDSVFGILQEIDKLVTLYRAKFSNISQAPLAKNITEQQEHEENVRRLKEQFQKQEGELLDLLNLEVGRLRQKQPVLAELEDKHFNRKKRLVRELAFGSLKVTYPECGNNQGRFRVPRTIPFPFRQSIYLSDEKELELLHLLILKLMYTLPLGQFQLYIYDPNGLGKSVQPLNRLFTEEKLFPSKEILHNSAMLDVVLRKLITHILFMRQKVFLNQSNWYDYNNFKYSQGQEDIMIPYQILVLLDVPDSFGSETFNEFKKMLRHGEDCGVLTIFSANIQALQTEHSSQEQQQRELLEAIKNSITLRDILNQGKDFAWCQSLEIEDFEENKLEISEYSEKTMLFKEAISHVDTDTTSFASLCRFHELYHENSSEGLSIPIGFQDDMPIPLTLHIGDAPVHYGLSGATGSGKSYFLHNFILSACCRYSPQELQLFLLDFKEGVEFNVYAMDKLPHATLVATEADPEYALSVLYYLQEEMERRNVEFKKAGESGALIRDVKGYRNYYPDRLMPRILVVVDEFQSLIENHSKVKEALKILDDLLRKGRNSGIHFLFSTQNLAGLNSFDALKGQVKGRISLKSDPNTEAKNMGVTDYGSNLPYVARFHGLMTDELGTMSKVKYFLIPDVEGQIKETIQKLYRLSHSVAEFARFSPMVAYSGEKLTKLPEEKDRKEVFSSQEGLMLRLGAKREFLSRKMEIPILKKKGHNLIVIGEDQKEPLKSGILQSLYFSAYFSSEMEEIVYVGDQQFSWDKLTCYKSPSEFVQSLKRNKHSRNTFLIMDNPDLSTLEGFSEMSKQKEESFRFFEHFQFGYQDGNHTAIFFDQAKELRSNLWKNNEEFYKYIFAFSMSQDKTEKFFGLGHSGFENVRVGYFYEKELKGIFFPYQFEEM